jgi:hypothetical protein
MIDFLWTYGELSALVVLLAGVWAWRSRNTRYEPYELDDEHSESDQWGKQ